MNDTLISYYSNRDFINELVKLKGQNLLVLLIDGSAVFGRMERIDAFVLAMIPATNIANLDFAQIYPHSSLALPLAASQLFIDSQNIANVAAGPFTVSPLQLATDKKALSASHKAHVPIPGYQYCKLSEELAALENQNIAVATMGDWVIGGLLEKVNRQQATISAATSDIPPLLTPNTITIYGSAFPLGIGLPEPSFKVWHNVKALQKIILP